MQGAINKTVLIIALLALGFTAQGDDADRAAAELVAKRLQAMLFLLPSQAMLDEVERVANDPSMALETRELGLYLLAQGLKDEAIDPVAWAVLEWLSHYQTQARQAHAESRGAHAIPLYPVASAARGTLNQWIGRAALIRAGQALRSGEIGLIDQLSRQALHPQQISGIARAIEDAPLQALAQWRPALAEGLAHRPALAPVAVAAAKRLHDRGLVAAVLQHAPSSDQARLLSQLGQVLGEEQAKHYWIELAWSQHPLAPLAMHQLALLGEGPHLAPLLGRLGEEQIGLAAAHALGRQGLALGPLVKLLQHEPPPLRAARVSLALHLNGSAKARAALANFSERTRHHRLSKQIKSWLQ